MNTLEQLEGLVSAKVGAFKSLFNLVRLEAKLAGLSVFPLILNLCLLFVILITLWATLMLLIGIGLYLTADNFLISVIGVLVFNLVFFLGLVKYLAFNLRNLSFEKTRAYFSQENVDHERIEKTNKSSD